MEQTPSVARIVHYVARPNSAGGPGVCRAAIITATTDRPDVIHLVKFAPAGGMVFYQDVPYDDPARETPGEPGKCDPGNHGRPFRYCICGWSEARLEPGTWHWPERV